MELSLIIGFGIAFILGMLIGVTVDVDKFAGRVFSKLAEFKDPHKAVGS